MQINGITVKQPKPLVVVIPTGYGDLVIKARYVSLKELEEFENILPEPKPPMKTEIKDGKPQLPYPDYTDKTYQAQRLEYHDKRMSWIYLTSLSATEGLEWDTVNMEDPATWDNWSKDLENSGLQNSYIIKISNLVTDAQGWNTQRVEEATQNFLAGAPVE